MNANKQNTIRIVMFPWLAHGHISPFLELAKRLTKRNFYIYICSTKINLNSIKHTISQQYFSSIELIELTLPSLPNLPPKYHTTNGLPPHLMSTLKEAFDMSSHNFSKILENIKPNLLIYDLLQPWAPEVAKSHNIPAINLITMGVGMCSYILHAIKNPTEKFPFEEIHVHDYMAQKLNTILESHSGGMKEKERYIRSCERSCEIILIKTFRELEGKYIDYLSGMLCKRIIPLGPLVQGPTEEKEDVSNTIAWLNKKEKASSIFVSFGSEYFLSDKEREEIAYGLEYSKVNFIWVMRFPAGEYSKLEDALPMGFFERVKERGLIVEGWAPQARILEHPSIGGFVSHCGWSSVMESMKFGVPIIAMPMHIDQPINAKIVEEVGVGFEVMRSRDGDLERGEISKAIRNILVEKDGESVRKKVKELSESIENKGEEEINEVVDSILHLCKMSSRLYIKDN